MPSGIHLEELDDIVGIASKLHLNTQTHDDHFVLTRQEVEEGIREHVGADVTDDTIEKAIDEYYASRLRFENPQTTLQQKISNTYINRAEIAKNALRKTGITALIATAAFATYGVFDLAQQLNKERNAEANVHALTTEIQEVRNNIQDINSSNYERLVPEQEIPDITQQLSFSQERLNQVTNQEAIQTITTSDVEELVTKENATKYNQLALSALDQLRPAKENLERASGVIEATRNYNTITDIVREEGVSEQAQNIYQAALTFENAADLNNFREKRQQLTDIKQTLGEEYRVIITGGVWRYSNDDPTVKNYYLEVQAVDDQGNLVTRILDNQETPEYERDAVTTWAENVTEEVYEQVKSDKMDNQIIDDNLFAEKEFGYISLNRRYPDRGQITEWEDWQ